MIKLEDIKQDIMKDLPEVQKQRKEAVGALKSLHKKLKELIKA